MPTYFDYRPDYTGKVQKGRTKLASVPTGSTLKYLKNKGFYTEVVRPKTQQQRTTIDTPAQVEARVTRMAQTAYDRQQSDLEAEVARMKKEALGRREGMVAAYAAAGKANAELATPIQAGWNTAADKIQGLANTTTGGIADALQADLATQEQALSRVGAGGTGFDARSQAGVEAYRGGTLPAENFARMGGIENEYILRGAQNLKERGMQEGIAQETQDIAKVDSDRLEQIRKLGENRTTYEADIRKQLLAARQDQIDAVNDAAKIVADIQSDAAKLKKDYYVARLRATTQKELKAVDAIFKTAQQENDARLADALIAQRNAAAGLSVAKTNNLIANPTGAPKPPSGSAIGAAVTRANKQGQAAIQQVFDNIWAKTPGAQAPSGWDEDKKGKYVNTAEHEAAVKAFNAQKQRSFGTIMDKTIKAVSQQMKQMGYTPAQIKRMAYDLVSARIVTPEWWKKLPQNKKIILTPSSASYPGV